MGGSEEIGDGFGAGTGSKVRTGSDDHTFQHVADHRRRRLEAAVHVAAERRLLDHRGDMVNHGSLCMCERSGRFRAL